MTSNDDDEAVVSFVSVGNFMNCEKITHVHIRRLCDPTSTRLKSMLQCWLPFRDGWGLCSGQAPSRDDR